MRIAQYTVNVVRHNDSLPIRQLLSILSIRRANDGTTMSTTATTSTTTSTTTSQAGREIAELTGLPGHLIRRVHQVSVALFAEECGDLDLTPVQYGAMVAIRANPGVDATRLAALIDFDRSTTGDVLDRLVSKRWVLRRASPKDGRVKVLRLSATGERILATAAPAVRRVQERLLEPLAPGDRDTLVRLLARAAGVDEERLPSWRGA